MWVSGGRGGGPGTVGVSVDEDVGWRDAGEGALSELERRLAC